jgi:HAD superfamily phosphoserine phosphatase-like hydrolase
VSGCHSRVTITIKNHYRNTQGKIMHNKLVLSDIDGTILRGSLVLQHAVYLHELGVINTGNLAHQWINDKKNDQLIGDLATAYKTGITGKTIQELHIDEFLETITNNEENFYTSIKLIQALQATGYDVILISGSPDFLVNKFGALYGFKTAGSSYYKDSNDCFTGDIKAMFTYDAKQEYINTLELDGTENITAFGDTQSDVPLFEVANYSILVDPNSNTLSKVQHLIHQVLTT